jgi:hypothetical protein
MGNIILLLFTAVCFVIQRRSDLCNGSVNLFMNIRALYYGCSILSSYFVAFLILCLFEFHWLCCVGLPMLLWQEVDVARYRVLFRYLGGLRRENMEREPVVRAHPVSGTSC